MKKVKMLGLLVVMLLLAGIFPVKTYAAGWIQGDNGLWWYQHEDESYTTSGWETIGGKNYYFDEAGRMKTGWLKLENTWYYLSIYGDMQTGWKNIGGAWYYLNEDGAMLTGWQNIGNNRFYLDGSGAMYTGWLKLGNNWYYMNNSGAMLRGWQSIGGAWYHLNEDGVMLTGWQKIGNNWFYLNGSGAMTTGWQNVGGTWYYMNNSGAMLTGWQVIGGAWYYLDGSGAMHTGWIRLGETWYYLTASGAMAANTWIGSYYVDENGEWIPGKVRSKIIAIDAGHQRKGNSAQEPIGPGASATKPKVASGTHGNASGLNEYELTLQVSLQLRDELEARGYEVYMIRTTHDVNISNAERAQMAAAAGADILVRIHANGSDNTSISGALTMAPSTSNPYLTKSVISASQTLSRKIVDSFCAATGAKNQGVMSTDAMSGINWSTIPVSIVEMGYMTNRAEDLKMASASYQAKMVQGIANGIDAYYGATA